MHRSRLSYGCVAVKGTPEECKNHTYTLAIVRACPNPACTYGTAFTLPAGVSRTTYERYVADCEGGHSRYEYPNLRVGSSHYATIYRFFWKLCRDANTEAKEADQRLQKEKQKERQNRYAERIRIAALEGLAEAAALQPSPPTVTPAPTPSQETPFPPMTPAIEGMDLSFMVANPLDLSDIV